MDCRSVSVKAAVSNFIDYFSDVKYKAAISERDKNVFIKSASVISFYASDSVWLARKVGHGHFTNT